MRKVRKTAYVECKRISIRLPSHTIWWFGFRKTFFSFNKTVHLRIVTDGAYSRTHLLATMFARFKSVGLFCRGYLKNKHRITSPTWKIQKIGRGKK